MKTKKIIAFSILSLLVVVSLVGIFCSYRLEKETILQVKERVAPELFAIEGIVGVGIQEGKIAVYVKEITDEILATIPTKIEGYDVIIIELGEIVLLQDRADK